MTAYTKLFEPITIGDTTFKNRIVMPPMNNGFGFRGRRALSYYGERARGGVGMMLSGGMPADIFMSDEAWGKEGAVDSFFEGTQALLDEVHQQGAKIGIQLWYGNRYPSGLSMYDTKGDQVAPSARDDMRELTTTETRDIMARFALAAAKIKDAGFDLVELHATHGYLASQFWSPVCNKRSDEYGGDLTRRMRFIVHSIAAMRQAVGKDYPISCRLGVARPSYGINIADCLLLAPELEKAGLSILSVTTAESTPLFCPTSEHPRGTYVPFAGVIKKTVNIPVVAVGRINSGELAESILSSGKADMIAVGRQLLADPYWPEKVALGREEDITPCLSCNTCLDGFFGPQGQIRCAVNPTVGREYECRLEPATMKKRVLVVGGGPAGLKASITSARRGHPVTLMEKEGRLGGQLLLAGIPPYKEPIMEQTSYLIRQAEKAGVQIKLNTEAIAKSIAEYQPDSVIVATGASQIIPDIPGVERDKVMTASELLAGKARAGDEVVVVGGGLVGCETAEYLLSQDKKVTILEMLDRIGADIEPQAGQPLVERIYRIGIKVVTNARVEEITAEGVRWKRNGKPKFLECDTVVLAVGSRSNKSLVGQLEGKVNLVVVGDCVEPRRIVDAISEGESAGRQV